MSFVPFISIDPAYKTLGIIVGYFEVKKTLVIVTIKKASVITITNYDELNFSDKIKEFDKIISSYMETINFLKNIKCLAIIEDQYQIFTPGKFKMSTKLNLIQNALFTILQVKYNTSPMFLKTSVYKVAIGIAKGNHLENKKAAVNLAEKLTGQKFNYQDNHICDCINQLYYCIWKSYPTLKFKFIFE